MFYPRYSGNISEYLAEYFGVSSRVAPFARTLTRARASERRREMENNAASAGAREPERGHWHTKRQRHLRARRRSSLSLSPFPSFAPNPPPLRNFTHFTAWLLQKRTVDTLESRCFRDESLANERERTNERTATSLSFGRASERVPFPANGTARYGTVRYREIGGPLHGGPRSSDCERKNQEAGPGGDGRVSRDAPGKLLAVRIPSFPRGSDLGVRLCGNHRHAGDVCRCVTDFFPPWRDTGWGAGTYDGTAICCNGGAPLGFCWGEGIQGRIDASQSLTLRSQNGA